MLGYLVVAIAAIAVYANTIGHGFVFDDVAGILDSPRIATFHDLSQAAQFFREPWRPVTQLSYALTIYVWGPDARPFHVTNVLIHAVNALLVYEIARRVARRWVSAERSGIFALAAGLLHAVHPLYTEAVAYIWGRSSSLCALFYFGSLLLAIRGYEEAGRGRYLYYASAVVCGGLAWFTKEEAITLPLVIAGFLAFAGSWRSAAALALAPLAAAAARWNAISRLAAQVSENEVLVSAGAEPTLDRFTYSLTYLEASVFYHLRMFLLPVKQSVDPTVEPVHRLTDPVFLASVLVLASLVAWGVVSIKRDRAISFALVALLASPLTAYVIMPLADVVAEHRVYVAGLGFDLLAGWIFSRRLRYGHAALIVVAIVLGFATVHRNRVWASDLTLWQDAERKSPGLARPHLNLGLAYQSAGRLDEAMAEYRHTLAVNPRLAPAHINLAGIFLSRNDLENAESSLKQAIALSPSLAEPYINLAVIALRRNQPVAALELLAKAESLADSHLVHLNRGDVLSHLGRYQEAVVEYTRAVNMRTDLAELKKQIDERMEWLRTSGFIR